MHRKQTWTREEVEKMAKELNSKLALSRLHEISIILGLEEVGEPETMGGYPISTSKEKPTETPKSEKWCEHMKPGIAHPIPDTFLGSQFTQWQFCPVCGTPSPQELSLLQRVTEAIGHCSHNASSVVFAQAAIKAYEEHHGSHS